MSTTESVKLTALIALIGELKSDPNPANVEARIQVYLRGLVGNKEADWLNGADMDKQNCPLGKPADGASCVDLLEKCLAGDISNCITEWEKVNWSAGFNDSNIDVGLAKNLLTKLQIDKENYDLGKWIVNKGLKIAPNVKFALHKIIEKVIKANGVASTRIEGRPASSSVVLLPLYPLSISGIMTGGGNKKSSNYLQMSDYLKNQLNFVGGGNKELLVPNTLSGLRQSFIALQRQLENIGKQIDGPDVLRINQLFDSLQSTEEKTRKAALYIDGLRKLISHPGFDNSSITGHVTAKMLQELYNTHEKLIKSSSNKTFSLIPILDTLLNAATATDVKKLSDKVETLIKTVSDMRTPSHPTPSAPPA
jgi:hypothetical protein